MKEAPAVLLYAVAALLLFLEILNWL